MLLIIVIFIYLVTIDSFKIVDLIQFPTNYCVKLNINKNIFFRVLYKGYTKCLMLLEIKHPVFSTFTVNFNDPIPVAMNSFPSVIADC